MRVVGVRQGLDERIPISMVLIDEDSESMYGRLVVPLCLAVGLSVIGQRLVMLGPEHGPDSRENLSYKLWSVV